MTRRLLATLALASCTVALMADEPIIDHQPVSCSLPGKNPRVCALIADDGAVKKAEVYFRAIGQKSFYRIPMTFDAVRYCATLPVPKKSVTAVQYYVRVIDDEALVERTIDHRIALDAGSTCEFPVIDEDPERVSRIVVHATEPKQGKKIRSFEPRSVARFVPFPKR